jgi:hypothetical protein
MAKGTGGLQKPESPQPGTSGTSSSGVLSQQVITPQVTPVNSKNTTLTFAKDDNSNTYDIQVDHESEPGSSNNENLTVSYDGNATGSKFTLKTSSKVAKKE